MRKLVEIERRWRAYYNVAPTDPETWARARIYNLWFDHAVLRLFWTNQMEIAPGVFRSNQPTPGRLIRLRDQGIKSILSLRGRADSAHYLTEKIYCAELGLTLHTLGFSDKAPPTRAGILALIDLFRHIEKPFVMHCKSGADRAGLAAAIYLLVITGQSLQEAQKMLSLRFFHIRRSHAGELDRVLAGFAQNGGGRDFETWVRTHYDPHNLPPR